MKKIRSIFVLIGLILGACTLGKGSNVELDSIKNPSVSILPDSLLPVPPPNEPGFIPRKRLALGIGIGRLTTKSTYRAGFPTIGISYDHPVSDNFLNVNWLTTGGYFGYTQYQYSPTEVFSAGSNSQVTEIKFGSRWGVEVNGLIADLTDIKLPSAFEFYAVFMLGYRYLGYEDGTVLSIVVPSYYSGIAGGGRFGNDWVQVFLELGATEAGFFRSGATFAF
jgi:hypothetical protein